MQGQDKWKEPRNRRTSDAEKKAPSPHPHAGFKGNGADVALTWDLLMVLGVG